MAFLALKSGQDSENRVAYSTKNPRSTHPPPPPALEIIMEDIFSEITHTLLPLKSQMVGPLVLSSSITSSRANFYC